VLCVRKTGGKFNSSPKCTTPQNQSYCRWWVKWIKTSVCRELRVGVLLIWVIWWQAATAFPVRCGNGLQSSFLPSWSTYPECLHNSHIMWGELTYSVPRTECRSLTRTARDINSCPSTSRCGWLPSQEVHHFWLDLKDSNHYHAKHCSPRYNVWSFQGKIS